MVALADPAGVKVYTVNGAASGSSSSLPDWLTRKRAKGRRREHVEGSLELIQDFEFPEASNKIKTTPDGKHALATGTYKPRLKCWDLTQLSLKFERHTDAENVDFICLSDDWTKSIHLQNDRTLEIHAQGGLHYRTRVPRFGRALAYHPSSCDTYIGGAGSDVWRLNLEQGRFLSPLALGDSVDSVNTVDVNPVHQLLAFGLDGPAVDFWDPRSRARVGTLRLPVSRLLPAGARAAVLPGIDDAADGGLSVTAVAARADGLSYAVGTSSGHSLLYDVRAARPYAIKDQGYGLPIRKLSWISGRGVAGDGLVLSADAKVIKVWDREAPAANFVAITPATDLNDVHHFPGSGLLLCANEGIRMNAFFVPQLGPAPRWAAFLENITEEMEDQTTRTVHEDFKFVERSELKTLGLDHLVGTPTLKPYMHGYFLSLKLYDTARVIANPFAYEEHRERLVQEKIDKMAETRIRARKEPGVKVNKALAARVLHHQEREAKRAERKRARAGGDAMDVDAEAEAEADSAEETHKESVLTDPRFAALFEDPEFEVDETTREYALTNPSAAAAHRGEGRADAGGKGVRRKTAVEEEEEESDKASSDGLGESEGEGSSDDSSDAGDLGQYDSRAREPVAGGRRAGPSSRTPNVKFVPLRPQVGGDRRPVNRSATFGQRRSDSGAPRTSKGKGRAHDAGMEISWVPSAGSAHDEPSERNRSRDGGGKGRKEKGVERFGAGMERGGEEDRRRSELSEAERRGRTERRKGIRSGSKNAIFRRT